MKNLLFILYVAAFGALVSCNSNGEVGPVGPAGPMGPEGPMGLPGEVGYVFEWSEIYFTAPDYEVFLPHPEDFEGLESDVALVYLLMGVDDNTGNEIWQQIPYTVFFEDGGLLQYGFDFTKSDVNLYLDANFPLNELGADQTDNWVARIVIVPGEFWDAGRVDFSNYYAVKEALGLPELSRRDHGSIQSRNFQ